MNRYIFNSSFRRPVVKTLMKGDYTILVGNVPIGKVTGHYVTRDSYADAMVVGPGVLYNGSSQRIEFGHE